MRLECKRLRDLLHAKADMVIGLENRKLQLGACRALRDGSQAIVPINTEVLPITNHHSLNQNSNQESVTSYRVSVFSS